ncbi:MAG: MBOAT family protein [Bacteroidota bacterium]
MPLLLGQYYLASSKLRNLVLIGFSLFFHAWGGIGFTFILFLSIVFNYFIAREVGKGGPRRKLYFQLGLAGNVLVLLVFKYLDFFVDNTNSLASLLGADHELLHHFNLALPLGISFFTFHQMSFLWDIYRSNDYGKLKFADSVLYVSFFPQLIAGPIVRYKDIIGQIKDRTETAALFHSGIWRFSLGLFKKLIFANTFAVIADEVMTKDPSVLTSSGAWMGILAYTLQIYFDFSGYSDMAIGLARMFGFRFMENFNFPYISTSIKEFWRRWHISLSNWFRDYVYIPLGGNKGSNSRTYFNLLVVFLLTGFWHGASWSFVFWGLFHGFFLVMERLGLDKLLNRVPKVLSWLYTMVIVMIGWVFFRIENFRLAARYVYRMLKCDTGSKYSAIRFLDNEKMVILALGLLSCTGIFLFLQQKARAAFPAILGPETNSYALLKGGLALLMFGYAVLTLNSGSYNPFIYFRF